jgi:hypothetical protein
VRLPKPVKLKCPECKQPFEPLGSGHLEGCSIGRRYNLPHLITTGHMALVFGSRTVPFSRHGEANAALDRLLWEHRDLVIMHGGAKGGDSLANDWADSRGVAKEVWPAKWRLIGQHIAGFWRNAEMAARLPQEAVALIGPCDRPDHMARAPHPTHGSVDMAMRLRAKGIPIIPLTWGIPASVGEFLRGKVEDQ